MSNAASPADDLDMASFDNEDLLRAIANETHQPIVDIKGYLQILLTERPGELTETQRKLIDLTLKNIEKIERINNAVIIRLNRKSGE